MTAKREKRRSTGASKRRNTAPAITRWLANRPLFAELGLTALTVLFGLQVLRVLVPDLTWVLGNPVNVGAVQLGAIALLVFLTAFLAGGLHRLLGNRWSIAITAGGLGLIRLLMQVWQEEPLFNLILAVVGTILFILFLPIYLDRVRLHGGAAVGHFALGLLAGFALDTAIHGAFATYDVVWQAGLVPLVLTVFLMLAQWLLLTARMAATGRGEATTGGTFGRKSLAWLAIGPFLFLQLVVFQNVARLAALTDWPLPFAFGWTLLAQLAGIATVVWLLRKENPAVWPLALICGAALIAVSVFPYPPEAWLVALTLLAGQVSLTLLIVLVLVGISDRVGNAGSSRVTTAHGVGMILLVVFLLGYYAVYQMNLPYSNTVLELVASVVLTVCALVPCATLKQGIQVSRRIWLVPALALVLLVLPLASILTWSEPEAIAGDGFPVRVMTYNLHNGFNVDGDLDMEALARVIENDQPDIIALQEISRGWLISGRLDMLTWLSRRLDMPYVSGPTADPVWGNAILSRYPIVEYSNYDLPPRDLFLLRGFTVAIIDLGGGDSLQVIATHFHHVKEDSDIRQLQSPVIVDFWGGASHTVVLGDLNAEPDAPEIVMLQQAGLVDTLAGMEPTSVYTFNSADPYQRIDYIWISPDLKASNALVISSTASDHLPVVVVIDD